MGQNKVLMGTITAAGIVLLLVIGYRMGQRKAQAPMPAETPIGTPMMQGAPGAEAENGPGHRRQQMARNGQGQGRNRESSDETTPGSGGNSGRNQGRAIKV